MADKGPPTTKRLRLSRNKKKTWRKLSRDVDDLLPEQTKSELVKRRSGGFYIDVGEPGQRRRPRRQQQQEQQQQKPQSATAQLLSGLRCHESLGGSSAAAVTTTPDAAATKRQKRFNDKPLERRAKRLSSLSATAAATAAAAAAVAAAPPASGMDLWSVGDAGGDEASTAETARLLQHHMRCTRQAPVKRRFNGFGGGGGGGGPGGQACLVPQSGASYNPSLTAHRALLADVSSAEVDKQRREDRLHGQLERHFPATVGAAAALDAAHLEEMTAGLFADDDDGEEEEDDDEEVAVEAAESMVQQQQSGRPSRKQNAENRRQKAAAAEAKRRKRVATDLGQLGAIGRQVSRGQLARQQVEAARQARRQQRAAGTKRLGRHKFEELEDEFQLAEELAPSLRQLRPQGDLFVDAVKSYQRRGIVEPRQRVSWRRRHPAKRYKKKVGADEAAAAAT